MNKMKRGAEQDDPYSDWWMLRIEDKLADTKTRLQTLREQVDQALADVPAALSLGENMNVQPVTLPLFASTSGRKRRQATWWRSRRWRTSWRGPASTF